MENVSAYLVCKEHIDDVKKFLRNFFVEKIGVSGDPERVTFKLLDTDSTINLIVGHNLPMTQNITFEIKCKYKEELEEYAKKHNKKVEDILVASHFLGTSIGRPNRFYYIKIPGPHNICKIDINFTEYES